MLRLVDEIADFGDAKPNSDKESQFFTHTVYRSEGVSYAFFTGDGSRYHQMDVLTGKGHYQLWVVLKGGLSVHFPRAASGLPILEDRGVLLQSGEKSTVASLPGSSVDAMVLSLSFGLLEKVSRGLEGFQGWESLAGEQEGYCIYLESKLGEVMQQIIRNLAFNEYEGCFKRHLVEMKVLELVVLMLMQQREQGVDVVVEAQATDEKILRQMHQVRDILLHQLADPPSLRKLALEVGTNESHLKRHFKEAFHQTVYGFVQDKRMEKALELLKDKDLRIVDIAEQLGYKHATHFSAAFKKYFGGHPKDYR
ncbi:helix-turn-helix transcriptional regulator [Lunatimonas salinarum]|uniref:helix-turn-helix transcriptional regulator n=1 Tax=Lunatimonas salinarum TaxID=1774590 RepID=UPI001ADEF845|nr:AraC family transcriptional regulator [Lunatimonas salinarum]